MAHFLVESQISQSFNKIVIFQGKQRGKSFTLLLKMHKVWKS